MCYNIAFLQKRLEKLSYRYKNVLPENHITKQDKNDIPTYYFVSGFEHPQLNIISTNGITLAQWGLIPHWIKSPTDAKQIRSKTLNAKGETVFEKPSFKKPIITNRCLLPVSGFFEWREYKKEKYPYFISVNGGELFSLAAIMDTWKNAETNQLHKTFSIITTEANSIMNQIHNTKKRMPLIIHPNQEFDWLNANCSISEITSLIKPYELNNITAHTVSQFINNTKNNRNNPLAIQKFDYPLLPEICA